MDLHYLSNGPWASCTQSDIRRNMVFTVRSQILPVIPLNRMYPTTDSPNRLNRYSDDCDYCYVSSNAVVYVLPRNDDIIPLRSMIRRTRDVGLISEGTLYERSNR